MKEFITIDLPRVGGVSESILLFTRHISRVIYSVKGTESNLKIAMSDGKYISLDNMTLTQFEKLLKKQDKS